MPVDRQRMRPWLEEQINSGSIQGLHWVNKEEKIFQIPWMHAARHGWNLVKDAPLFMNWAIHTGKYRPGLDPPDPKTWKANFRCAMNSLHDIEEVKDQSMKRGNNAFRMYRMLSPCESAIKKGKKKMEGGEHKTKRRRTKTRCSDLILPNEDTLPDSTSVFLMEPETGFDPRMLYRTMASAAPDVCAVVEIKTENKESVVSSTQIPHKLQVSPVSSYGEGENRSTRSEDDSIEVCHAEDLSISSASRSTSSVLRFPPSATQRTHSFTKSPKENFYVTTFQEESPLIPYKEPAWCSFFNSFPLDTVLDLSTSSTSRSRENVNAVDLSSTAEPAQ